MSIGSPDSTVGIEDHPASAEPVRTAATPHGKSPSRIAFDRLRKEVAIIIVDHHLDLALALSDTTVALERGRVIHQGPSRALRDDLDLRRKVLWL